MAGNAVVMLRSLKAEVASVELTKNSKGPQTGEHIARQNHDSDGVEMDTSVIRLSVVGEWSDETFYTCQWTVGSVQSTYLKKTWMIRMKPSYTAQVDTHHYKSHN